MTTTILAERLRAARKALFPEVTQVDVAKRLGRSPSAVNLWEKSKGEPSAEHLVELSRIYKVSCDWLLGATDTIEPLGRSSIYTVPVVSLDALGSGEWSVTTDTRLQTTQPYTRGAAVVVDNDALRSICPPGSFAVVVPGKTPNPGDVVAAMPPGAARPILRRLVEEAGALLLVADDSRFPTHTVTEDVRLVGVVREVTVRAVM